MNDVILTYNHDTKVFSLQYTNADGKEMVEHHHSIKSAVISFKAVIIIKWATED